MISEVLSHIWIWNEVFRTNIEECKEKMSIYEYYEARVKKLDCMYFGDEVHLIHEYYDEYDISYQFTGCCKIIFDHDKGSNKWGPVSKMSLAQIPYFMFNIDIEEVTEQNEKFCSISIDMGLLEVVIWCKDINVTKIRSIRITGER